MFSSKDFIKFVEDGNEARVKFIIQNYINAKRLGISVPPDFFGTDRYYFRSEIGSSIYDGRILGEVCFSLHVAVLHGHAAILKQLLAINLDVNQRTRIKVIDADDCRDFYQGQTPLMMAVRMGNEELVDILLSAQANPNIPEYEGCTDTALHIALKKCHYHLVAKLIAAGNAVNSAPYRVSPLHIAASHQDVNMVKLLIQHGANVNATVLKGKEDRRASPLEFALPNLEIAKVLLDTKKVHPDIIQSLCTHYANTNSLDLISFLMKYLEIEHLGEIALPLFHKDTDSSRRLLMASKSAKFFVQINHVLDTTDEVDKLLSLIKAGLQSWSGILSYYPAASDILCKSLNRIIMKSAPQDWQRGLKLLIENLQDTKQITQVNYYIAQALIADGHLLLAADYLAAIEQPEGDLDEDEKKFLEEAIMVRTMNLASLEENHLLPEAAHDHQERLKNIKDKVFDNEINDFELLNTHEEIPIIPHHLSFFVDMHRLGTHAAKEAVSIRMIP